MAINMSLHGNPFGPRVVDQRALTTFDWLVRFFGALFTPLVTFLFQFLLFSASSCSHVWWCFGVHTRDTLSRISTQDWSKLMYNGRRVKMKSRIRSVDPLRVVGLRLLDHLPRRHRFKLSFHESDPLPMSDYLTAIFPADS
mmetsp:Transcript_3136/g.8861  ORF Transcript_3136/g.8861 Transcript_3136/m.8861 type:complete len:141 (-) Transcript_3136:911-1333(-)